MTTSDLSFDSLRQVWPLLDERQRRLMGAALARALGRGGAAVVTREFGLSSATIRSGIQELDAGDIPPGRLRTPGAGRPKA